MFTCFFTVYDSHIFFSGNLCILYFFKDEWLYNHSWLKLYVPCHFKTYFFVVPVAVIFQPSIRLTLLTINLDNCRQKNQKKILITVVKKFNFCLKFTHKFETTRCLLFTKLIAISDWSFISSRHLLKHEDEI